MAKKKTRKKSGLRLARRGPLGTAGDKKKPKKKKVKAAKVTRDGKGRWLPGSIPNPAGRPKGSVSPTDLLVQSLEREYGKGKVPRSIAQELIDRMVDVAVDKAMNQDSFKDVLLFFREWCDRTLGKPKQALEVTKKESKYDAMSDAEIEALEVEGRAVVEANAEGE